MSVHCKTRRVHKSTSSSVPCTRTTFQKRWLPAPLGCLASCSLRISLCGRATTHLRCPLDLLWGLALFRHRSLKPMNWRVASRRTDFRDNTRPCCNAAEIFKCLSCVLGKHVLDRDRTHTQQPLDTASTTRSLRQRPSWEALVLHIETHL